MYSCKRSRGCARRTSVEPEVNQRSEGVDASADQCALFGIVYILICPQVARAIPGEGKVFLQNWSPLIACTSCETTRCKHEMLHCGVLVVLQALTLESGSSWKFGPTSGDSTRSTSPNLPPRHCANIPGSQQTPEDCICRLLSRRKSPRVAPHRCRVL